LRGNPNEGLRRPEDPEYAVEDLKLLCEVQGRL